VQRCPVATLISPAAFGLPFFFTESTGGLREKAAGLPDGECQKISQLPILSSLSLETPSQWEHSSSADGGRIAMPTESTIPAAGPDVKELLAELEIPFSPDQVQWRVTNTTNDKKRGQVVPYADPRAYTDRLNTLFSPRAGRASTRSTR
jgi:hypothetical protein